MTKKELTSLLVAFLGGWLIVQMLVSLVMPIMTSITSLWSAANGRFDLSLLWAIAVGLIPALAYGSLAWLIIRRSEFFADRLLHHAKIQKEEKIEGIGLAGLSPLLFSMVGLYFMLSYAPSLLVSAGRWFAIEAASGAILGDVDRAASAAQHQSQMIYDAVVFIMALFVFRRPDWLASLVQRPRKTPNQAPEPTAPSGRGSSLTFGKK
jgi:hypothetical protein